MSVLTTTMMTGLDDLDLECLHRRIGAAIRDLEESTTPARIVRTDHRDAAVAGRTSARAWDDVLEIGTKSIGALGVLNLKMPEPEWWDESPDAVKDGMMNAMRMWLELTGSPRASLGNSVVTEDTGLEVLAATIGAVLSSEGADPTGCPELIVRTELPFTRRRNPRGCEPSIRIDPRSRTVGAAQPRALSIEAEERILDRHRAFQLNTDGPRRYSIVVPPPIRMTVRQAGPMEMLRMLRELDLKPGQKHVLKAARGTRP
jgi:hypothetical protein